METGEPLPVIGHGRGTLLAWSGVNARFTSGCARNAVDRPNEELACDGKIEFIDARIQNGPNGEIPAESWNPTLDQEEVFDDLLEAPVEIPENGVKEFILDQMDEDDPTLSNAHFVFTHDVGRRRATLMPPGR